MAKSKIKHIGFEIEGEYDSGFERDIRDKVPGCQMKGDGSVRVEKNRLLNAREFNSPVLSRTSNKIKAIFGLYDKAYKENRFNFNDSCGFHIHVSFLPERPPEILSYLFYKTFIENLKNKFPHVIDKRLGNRFCSKVANDEEVWKGHDRYRAVNFAPALSRHGTIEFRIFPSDTPEMMQAYLDFTLNQIKAFINSDHKIEFSTKLAELGPSEIIRHNREVDIVPVNRQINAE